MIETITHFFVQNITSFIETFGLAAVFILMTAESALIPIPSEVTMPFAGFLAGQGHLNFWMVVFIGAIANVVGSLLAYWLGYKKGEAWTRSYIKKYGKWFLIKEKEFDRAKDWFTRYGQVIAFTSRLLPVVRTFISLPAGITKMNLPKFIVFTFFGSFIWSLFLAYLGLQLGQNWQAIEPYFRRFQFLIVGFGIFGVVFYVRSHIKHKH